MQGQMATILYARVSTTEQTIEHQRTQAEKAGLTGVHHSTQRHGGGDCAGGGNGLQWTPALRRGGVRTRYRHSMIR